MFLWYEVRILVRPSFVAVYAFHNFLYYRIDSTFKFRGVPSSLGGPLMVAQWLRYCATNRKVAGSIPDGVSGIFH
jgi:hypothetical protein